MDLPPIAGRSLRVPAWVATAAGHTILRGMGYPGRHIFGEPGRWRMRERGGRRFVVHTADGTHLDAWWLPPRGGSPGPTVVMLHGWTEFKEMHLAQALRLQHLGHPVVMYDARGHGASAGRPTTFGVRERADLSAVIDAALADAQAWAEARANGLMMENFGDVPFYKGDVPRETVAAMTAVASEVRRAHPGLPLGINVLRNDGMSAIAVAAAVGANYVRVNVLSGAAVTDQGVSEGRAAEIMRYRKALGAEGIRVLADVRVKHAAPLAERDLQDEVEELVHRAGADAVIVSGTGTGKPTDPGHVQEVKKYAGDTPVLIGSGADANSIPQLKGACDGFIIGSAAKPGGKIDEPVDLALAKEMTQSS